MQVGGHLHQMVHMHGDIALLVKSTIPESIVIPVLGRVPLEKSTMAEDPFNSLSKSSTWLIS